MKCYGMIEVWKKVGFLSIEKWHDVEKDDCFAVLQRG
jgi:hypothetical protein